MFACILLLKICLVFKQSVTVVLRKCSVQIRKNINCSKNFVELARKFPTPLVKYKSKRDMEVDYVNIPVI